MLQNNMTDIDTSPVVWPKWCYASNQADTDPSGELGTTTIPISKNLKKRFRVPHTEDKMQVDAAVTADPTAIKSERFSPDQSAHDSASPSGSPTSPGSLRTRTPSFPGTPPNPAFTPPERFSPGSNPSVKTTEPMMARNYSDFMRSLAAKYNNSNPADYLSTSRNGLLGGLDVRFPFKPGAAPLLGLGAIPPIPTTLTPTKDSGDTKKLETPHPPPPPPPPHLLAGAGLGAFPGFPMMDMSSTQALLNMVRSASSTASSLESYLRTTVKRPSAELATSTSPLDLSSSPTESLPSKKPRLDANRNFTNLFGLKQPTPPTQQQSPESEEASKGGKGGSTLVATCLSTCKDQRLQSIASWSVDDVCTFVSSIDLCAEYVEVFREQSIDGTALPMLTEEHLTTNMNMKLGPALKLRSVVSKKLGQCPVCAHCVHCHGPQPPAEKRPSSNGQQPS